MMPPWPHPICITNYITHLSSPGLHSPDGDAADGVVDGGGGVGGIWSSRTGELE